MLTPIGFTLSPQTIYITSNSKLNELVLTLTNQSGKPMALKGGTPVPEANIKEGGPSTFYFSFGTLLTAQELRNLEVNAPGWTAAYFSGTFSNWGVCPAVDLTLPDHGSVVFRISNLLASGQPAPGQMTIDYYNYPGAPDSETQIKVFRQNAPDGPTNLVLTNGFIDGKDVVYTTLDSTTPVLNTLYFGISNPSRTQGIVTQPWGSVPPAFNITFIYSGPPGYGALTTAQLAADINISISEENQGNWTIKRDVEGLYWVLKPTTANPQVFAAGASIELTISSLRTDLPVGSAPDLTNMFIQYANLPGYNDGFFSAQIAKEAGPAILSFYSDPATLFKRNSAEATIYWESTENVGKVAFQGGGIGPAFYNRSGKLPATIAVGQGITMTAYRSSDARSGEKALGLPSVSRTLVPADTTVSSVDLPFEGAGSIILPNSNEAFVFQGSLVGEVSAKFAVIDLKNGQISPYDFVSLLGLKYGKQLSIAALAASPDGSAIYVIVLSAPRSDQGHALLVTVNVSTHAMDLVLDLGHLAYFALPCGLETTADGRMLYFTWFDLKAYLDSKETKVVGGLWTISTTNFKILNQYDWPQPSNLLAPPLLLVGTSPDGTKAIVGGLNILAIFDIPSGFKLIQQLEIDGFILPLLSAFALSSDAQYLYALNGSVPVKDKPTPPPHLLVLHIDPTTYAISIVHRVLLNTAGALTLGAEDKTLYMTAAQDVIVYDTTSFTAVNFVWGNNDKYSANVAAVDLERDNVIYLASNQNWKTLTVTPWPLPPSPCTGIRRPSHAGRNTLKEALSHFAGAQDQSTEGFNEAMRLLLSLPVPM